MTAPFSVRDARPGDAEAITDIYNQAIPTGHAEWTESLHTVDDRLAWMRRRDAADRPVIVAVDHDRKEVVGVASYDDFRESTCREGFRYVAEHSVYVDASAHGSGVADVLMDELEHRASASGLRVLLATVDGRNERSIGFHLRRGFEVVGRLPKVGYTFGVWRDFVILQLDMHPPVDGSPPSPDERSSTTHR